jgi:hypothetical protein
MNFSSLRHKFKLKFELTQDFEWTRFYRILCEIKVKECMLITSRRKATKTDEFLIYFTTILCKIQHLNTKPLSILCCCIKKPSATCACTQFSQNRCQSDCKHDCGFVWALSPEKSNMFKDIFFYFSMMCYY